MRRTNNLSALTGRALLVAAIALAVGIILFQSFRAEWGVQPSSAQDVEESYVPVVVADDGNPNWPPTTTVTPMSSTTPTATTIPPTMTPTQTPTATATATNTVEPTATNTAEPTATATNTVEPTATNTAGPTATATSTVESTEQPTNTPTPSATPTELPPGEEMLVFDWNKPVTKAEGGFAVDNPPLANGDWTQPINFAGGKLHFRAEIFSQPVEQVDMRLGFCFWQLELENCNGEKVPGVPGTVVTWSVPIANMYKKDGIPIVWSNPRNRNGFAVRNKKNLPVSNKAGMDWNGEDPDAWYPLDLRFTVVVVEEGAGFSGWDNYIP